MHDFSDILGQDRAVHDLLRSHQADCLPHGLIFAGPVGVGKGTTAAALAKLFLCEKPQKDRACGRCDSCRLFDAGNHPDYHFIYRQLARIEKEKVKARDLTIDVIRQFLVGPANLKAAMGRGKFFVVEEADLMNAAAQNAMLKTLEEPPGRTLIVLVTDQPGALFATVRSRCQTIRFASLDRKLVVDQLKKRGVDASTAAEAAELSDGSLGVALKWIEDGVIAPAMDLRRQLDAGIDVAGLPNWFRAVAEKYAEKQLERDDLASKDQATKEGLAVYLRIAGNHFRQKLAAGSSLERDCSSIEAIARAENYLDANVNVPIVFQQLALAIHDEK